MIDITNGTLQTLITDGTYNISSIQVNLFPTASSLGATASWAVDLVTQSFASGDIVENLPAGKRRVTFSPLAGYNSPQAISVTLVAGQLTTVIQGYDPSK
jgi:hypothetical protein